jgi:hypothetical protein
MSEPITAEPFERMSEEQIDDAEYDVTVMAIAYGDWDKNWKRSGDIFAALRAAYAELDAKDRQILEITDAVIRRFSK